MSDRDEISMGRAIRRFRISVRNDDDSILNSYTPPVQLLASFVIGLVLSPFSNGLIVLILYIIVNELVVITYYMNSRQRYDVVWRSGIIAAGFLGFIIGRISMDNHEIVRGSYTREFESDRTRIRLNKHKEKNKKKDKQR